VTKMTKEQLKVRRVDNDIVLGIRRALSMSWLTDETKGFLKVTQTVRIDEDRYKSANGNARPCHVILQAGSQLGPSSPVDWGWWCIAPGCGCTHWQIYRGINMGRARIGERHLLCGLLVVSPGMRGRKKGCLFVFQQNQA